MLVVLMYICIYTCVHIHTYVYKYMNIYVHIYMLPIHVLPGLRYATQQCTDLHEVLCFVGDVIGLMASFALPLCLAQAGHHPHELLTTNLSY